MNEKDMAKYLIRINAICDAGLTYGKDIFDKERYSEIKSVLEEITGEITDLNENELGEFLRPTAWYPTPLVDTRVFLTKEGKILLVRDNKKKEWALPGGYGEVGCSPKENALKELLEEAGILGEITRLLAVFDTNKHQFQSRQYYKLVFGAKIISEKFMANSETDEVGYFSLEELPLLSLNRNTKDQLEILLQMAKSGETYLD